ncbi:TPA: hypothetical protein HA243_01600 [Candidatus Micrarchaeota archaeon]|nr:hypothetical protein [Candidatus Micrarchaeota archaeon]
MTSAFKLNTNRNLGPASRYSLRGNPVVALAQEMERKILQNGPLEVSWGGKKLIKEVIRLNLGDLFLPGGHRPPRTMAKTGVLVEELFTHNYSMSAGYLKARRAVQLYYRTAYGAEIPENRIFLGEGVTGLMETVGKLFMESNGENPPSFGSGAIFYPPWVGTMMDFGLQPVFFKVDGRHQPSITESRLDASARFVILYSVGNPGGMLMDLQTAESAAAEIRKAMERTGNAIFLVVDDAYEQFISEEKRLDFFRIADKARVPLMLLSGFDKPASTGYHGGWMVVHIPKGMEGIGLEFDSKVGDVYSQYLGTNTSAQFKMMVYNLVRANLPGKDIKDWILEPPNNEPTRRWPEKKLQRLVGKYEKTGFFEKTGTLIEDIERNLRLSETRMDRVLSHLEKAGEYLELPGSKPDIPFYLFLKLRESGPWTDANGFVVDVFKNTGIALSPGHSFIADEFLSDAGLCFRIAITVDPAMKKLDGDGKVNFAKVLGQFIRYRAEHGIS